MAGLLGTVLGVAANAAGHAVKTTLNNTQKSTSKKNTSSVPKTGAEQADLIRQIESNYKGGGITESQRNAAIQDVLDGKSIYDPAAGYNSGAGSTRPGTTAIGGGGGYQSSSGSGYAGGSYATMDDYLSAYQQQMQAAKEAEEAALRAKIDQSVESLMGQIPSLNQQYDNMAKESYKNYMLGQREMQNQLQRLGLSGQGITETTQSGLLTDYQNALQSGEQARAEAVRGIESDASQIRATGDVGIAQNAASYSQQLANALLEARARQAEQQLQMQQWELENQRYDTEWQQSLESEEYQRRLQAAQLAAQYGDYTALAELTGGDAAAYKSYVDKLNAPKVSYGGGGTGGSSGKLNETTFGLALAAAQNGDRSAAVRSVIESYSGLPMETVLATQGVMATPALSYPISNAKQEMLMGWLGNGTPAEITLFEEKAAQAIKAGTLTPDEVNSFLQRRGIA